MIEHTLTRKRSLGKLRVARKTKELSPNMTGTLRLQRHTATAILKAFENTDDDEAVCNNAAWVNRDDEVQYLTVELSPKYVAPDSHNQQTNPSPSLSRMRRTAVDDASLEINRRSCRLSRLKRPISVSR